MATLPNETTPFTARPPRRTWLAVLGVVLCLAAPFAYMALLDQPFLRSTGLAGFGLLIAGTLLGWVAALQDPRWRIRILAIIETLFLVFGIYGFFGLGAVPESPSFAALTSPPDFSLPDHTGQPVKLSDAYSTGPVLLVFYRGFW
ncbi:MAG TPA: hypothetical protein VJZ71_19440 [Phycisphaerae bacterium]|nr:hypothetical protein [Phycisphaerae bacterium]